MPSRLYIHLTNLVFGVRLLLETSSEDSIKKAEVLLNSFCRDIDEIHGLEKIETINVHCVLHLCDQVRRFGPLLSYSAMSFEAANRTLGEVFTGSNTECEVICRRVLQKHRLAQSDIQNGNLRKIFDGLSGIKQVESSLSSDGMLETESLKEGRMQYLNASFFNRQVLHDTYFDSKAFKKSKYGNCYVSWLEN